jgi:hypothetical protein
MSRAHVLQYGGKTYVARLPRPRTADDPEFWECL